MERAERRPLRISDFVNTAILAAIALVFLFPILYLLFE